MKALLLLLLLFLPPIHCTKADVNREDTLLLDSKDVVAISNLANAVFGLTSAGTFTAHLQTTTLPNVECEYELQLALCRSDGIYVRSPGFELRHALQGAVPVYKDLQDKACAAHRNCHRRIANESISISNLDRGMYTAFLFVCNSCPNDENRRYPIEFQGRFEFRNDDLRYPQLGFEENAFPIVAAVAMAISSLCCLLLLLGWLYGFIHKLPVRAVYIVILIACVLKGLGSGLTFYYFFNVAQTGKRRSWYVYYRWTLGALADIMFIFGVMMLSAGYRVLPESWFVEGRSPVFVVYIGVTLQILIIIAVKLMFPFRYIGILTYTVAGGVIALLGATASSRLRAFLGRYIVLLKRAHIYPRSTPIPSMRVFYALNSMLLPVIYLAKIVNLGVWDYRIRRPDLVWGCLEIADAVLLFWYTLAVIPRRHSVLYVDVSNLSNDRLQRAEAWRGARAQADAAEQAEEGRAQEPVPETPQPEWVDWEPGSALPRPDESTWGGYVQVSRILRRERKLVPVLPSSVVLGAPADDDGTMRLTVGMPTAGPRLVPREFDEKGVEVDRGGEVEASVEEDREDRRTWGRIRRRREESGMSVEGERTQREISLLAPSVASSGASADGVLVVRRDAEGR